MDQHEDGLYWFVDRDSPIGLRIPKILGTIILYNVQPTEVLNTAHVAFSESMNDTAMPEMPCS